MSTKERFVRVPVSLIEQVIHKEIGRDEAWLNVVMLYHVNDQRGDSAIWPTRETLAAEMGVTKPANVDKYVTALEAAGNVKVERRTVGRHRTRNRYTVLNVVERSMVPTSAPSIVPESGHSIVPNLGPELYEGELDEGELNELSPSPPGEGFASTLPRQGRRSEDQQRVDDEQATRNFLANQRGTDEDADLIIDFMRAGAPRSRNRKPNTINNLLAYIQHIADVGGETGIETFVESARSWHDDLATAAWRQNRGQHIADWIKSERPKMRLIERIAEAYTHALQAGVDDADLLAACNEVRQGPRRGQHQAYVSAIQSEENRHGNEMEYVA